MEYSKYIFIDGTSTSGKSYICKTLDNLYPNKYIIVAGDDYIKGVKEEYKKYYTSLEKTKFITKKEKQKVQDEMMCQIIFRKCIEKQKETGKTILIDWVLTQPLERIFRENNVALYIINIYTPVEKLIDNMIKRRSEFDTRGLFVFSQFSDRYKKSGADCKNYKKVIKISEFIDKLKSNLCFEFDNEDELIKFSEKLYFNLGFSKDEFDKEDLYISLREDICDLFIDTNEKEFMNYFCSSDALVFAPTTYKQKYKTYKEMYWKQMNKL